MLEPGGKNNKQNYVNHEFFDKQIIFSLNAKLIFNTYDIIGDSILYHDRFKREYYYVKSKSESDYPEIKIKFMKDNQKINENEKYLWIAIPEMARMNEQLDNIARNNRLFSMDKVFHFPFSILKGGRIYILDQYHSDIGEAVSRRMLKLKNNYDRILGPQSLNIESIGSNLINAVDFLNIMGLKFSVIELKIKMDCSGCEITGLLKTASSDLDGIQLLVSYDKGLKVFNLDETVKSGHMPSKIFIPLEEIFKMNSLFLLYSDFRCSGGECIFTMIFEENFMDVVSEALEKAMEKGMGVQIYSYRKINPNL